MRRDLKVVLGGGGSARFLRSLGNPLRGRTIAGRRLLPLLGGHLLTTAEALGRDATAACCVAVPVSLNRRTKKAKTANCVTIYSQDVNVAANSTSLLVLRVYRS